MVMLILIHTLVGDVVCALLAAQEDHHPLRTHAFHAFHAFHALRTHADQHHHQACITSHPPSSNILLLHHLLSFPPITHASQPSMLIYSLLHLALFGSIDCCKEVLSFPSTPLLYLLLIPQPFILSLQSFLSPSVPVAYLRQDNLTICHINLPLWCTPNEPLHFYLSNHIPLHSPGSTKEQTAFKTNYPSSLQHSNNLWRYMFNKQVDNYPSHIWRRLQVPPHLAASSTAYLKHVDLLLLL